MGTMEMVEGNTIGLVLTTKRKYKILTEYK
ncbi:hypothetical protein ES708_33432 [subsurface metagenome]